MRAGYLVVFEAREGGDEGKAIFACRALCRADHPRAVRRIRQPGAKPSSPTSFKEGEVPDLPRFDNAISFSRHTRQSAARSPRPRLLIFVVAYHAETTIDEVSTRILGTVLGPVARSHDGAVNV